MAISITPGDGSTELGGDIAGGRGRLVVVSNRVPIPSGADSPSAGGLAVALEAALRQRGGLWFGWSGETSDSDEPKPVQLHHVGAVTYAVSDLARRDLDDYYFGFANRALWPVCHYRLDLTGFSRRNTAGYFRANEFFARRLVPLLQPDDLIWVHDYHFIPLASYLREMGCTNRIGFFMHIPWPPADVAGVLPAYDLLLRGFSAYDVVGFQTPLDADNFVNGLTRQGLGRSLGNGFYEAFGRRFLVDAFPIGIDTPAFRREAEQSERHPLVRRTKASLEGKQLIIGVDRLDYSKGIGQRIEAFSCFLENNPSMRGRVTFLQITPKTRSQVPEYAEMQREVAEQVGSMNGKYGDLDWTPIRYTNRPVNHSALTGLYRMARVGLVTPLRDGMNLVAKEYVASQSAADPGVLILSRFAGAAQELDGALLVNPYDTDATAAAMLRALAMPLEERQERWAAMMARIEDNTVQHWCASFVETLVDDGVVPLSPETIAVSREPDAPTTVGRPVAGGRPSAPWSITKN
jgi:trehalose 6-phosphate synthase